MGLFEHLGQFGSQPFHFVVKRFPIILLFFYANISSRSKNIILLCNIFRGLHGTEALHILKSTFLESSESICQLLNIFVRKIPVFTVYHMPHFTSINKHRFAFLFFIFSDEPQSYWDSHTIEKLRRHGNNALDQIILNDILSDFTFTTGLSRKSPISKDEPNFPVFCQMEDHMLNPGIVGVACWWLSIVPPLISL